MSLPDLTASALYPNNPQSDCDLIMKGGISSGIIYPRAACTLALTYRFRSIGGASAGAIAAAAVAAAEHGRASDGFVRLAALPDKLGTTLSGLFQPGPATKRPFAILSTWLEPNQSRPHKLMSSLKAVAAEAPMVFAAALGFMLVIPFAALGLTAGAGALPWLGWIIAALVWFPAAALLALAAAGYVCTTRALASMTGNGFGLCNGHQRDAEANTAPLTDWMTQTFNYLAGLPCEGPPLTFGDLWGDAAVAQQQAIAERDRREAHVDFAERLAAVGTRQVDLVVMTTCLTFQRPYQFPFAGNTFYFCPDHLREYFPDPVVDHIVGKAPEELPGGTDIVGGLRQPMLMLCPSHGTQVRHLPAPWDIPIVVAARLSLSFPGLISAVPFFTIDWARKPGKRGLIPVWFSDGGISSNFPMHLFDSPFPGRPTFGINLSPVNPDYPEQMVWMPKRQGYSSPPEATPLPGMLAFGHSILNTMQDWVDNTQITMPGYRDRIVTVRQRPGEGGMNLKMPAPTIATLANRGAEAAREFAGFDLNLHKWIRYRVAMSGTDDMLTSLNLKYKNGFRDFIASYGPATERYKPGSARATTADVAATEGLMSLADHWAASAHPSSAGIVPRPKPDLRFVPRQ